MKIAIIGGSGMIGTAAVAEAAARGHQVTAIARNEEKIEKADKVTPTYGDIEDGDGLAGTLVGHDAIVSSVRFLDFDPKALLGAVRKSGVKRWVMVGGAGSLQVEPGKIFLDSENFPEPARPEASAGKAAVDVIKQADDLDWTVVCPSGQIAPGERTGSYRTGDDTLIFDADGKAHISVPDFAIALIDVLESGNHIRQKFSVGY